MGVVLVGHINRAFRPSVSRQAYRLLRPSLHAMAPHGRDRLGAGGGLASVARSRRAASRPEQKRLHLRPRTLMKSVVRLALLLLALLLAHWPGAARAQFGPAKSHLTPSLVADTTSIEPGQPFTVGILLKIDPDWHTYWRSAGEIGLPLEVAWNLPPGFQASELEWPLPHALMDGDFLNYVYEKEAMVM